MEKSEILRINKNIKPILEEKEKSKGNHKNKKDNEQTLDDITELPNTIRIGPSENKELKEKDDLEKKDIQIVLSNPKSQKNDKPEEKIPYETPVVVNNKARKNRPIVNQLEPSLTIIQKVMNGSKEITCPFCKKKNYTRIEESFNCGTCGCYLLAVILVFPIFILVLGSVGGRRHRRKRREFFSENSMSIWDVCCCCILGTKPCSCCYDINHYCSNCGEKVEMIDSLVECCPCCEHCCE